MINYVIRDDQGIVTCLLCNTGSMRDDKHIKQHFNGRRYLNNFLNEAKDCKPRIDVLGFKPWKHHVQSSLFTAIIDHTSVILLNETLNQLDK